MQRTFTSRQLRQHGQDLAEKFGGIAALAHTLGCDQSHLSRFLLGHAATSGALLAALGVHFDVRQGLYVQDDEAAGQGATKINASLVDENRRLREQIKSLHIKLSKAEAKIESEAA
jgi:hypothetical protein